MALLGSLVLLATLVACGSDKGSLADPGRAPRTVRVPQDQPTIAAAVAKAVPGDLILVSPGTYREAVVVGVPRIEIRGTSRAGVVLDGHHALANGFKVVAEGVAIANLTVKDYAINGIVFDGTVPGASPTAAPRVLAGFRASYVTATGNGLYGVYAFSFRRGEFDHLYASGNPDSGIYVGQCQPCDAVVRDSLAEYNAIGYEGTNAGGNLFVIHSVFRQNRVGMTANTEDKERLAPQRSAVFAGNLVVDNDQRDAPPVGEGGFGTGIAIAGGTRDQIVHNRVSGNSVAGIVVTDLDGHLPANNQVRANILEHNGTDLIYGWQGAATEQAGNCFAGNTFTTSGPEAIERVLACRGPATTTALRQLQFPASPPAGTGAIPAPPRLPDLPAAGTAPRRATPAGPPSVDLASITVPAAP